MGCLVKESKDCRALIEGGLIDSVKWLIMRIWVNLS